MRRALIEIVCAVSLAAAFPLGAQPSAVINGEFNTDLSSWTQGGVFGSAWNGTDGSSPEATVLGSADLSTAATGIDDLLTQCINLSTSLALATNFDLGGRIKNVQFVASSSIRVDFFANSTCGSTNTGNSTAGSGVAVTNGFTEFKNTNVPRPASTSSALVTLRVHKTNPNPDNAAVARFDHIFLTPSVSSVIVNGEFDADITPGWTQAGSFNSFWDGTDGSSPKATVLGSAQLSTSSTSSALDDLLTQCIDLSTGLASVTSFDFGGRIKDVQFVGSSSIRVDFFSNSVCGSTNTGDSTAANGAAATNGFTEFKNTGVARPASTGSALLTLRVHKTNVNPDNTSVARFDHIFFGPPGTTPVELHSFTAE